MTRRIKRHRDFEVVLEIGNDRFIRPPRESQRNWLINRSMSEFSSDLAALDAIAARFVPGSETLDIADRAHVTLSDEEIMEDWQIPLMEAMAADVTENRGSILEIGFGRGIASTLIQDEGIDQHTIIECNDSVIERYQKWKTQYPSRDIRLERGLWQDVIDELGEFDGVFFHTYPLNEDEFIEHIAGGVTFAEHFFPFAAEHLRPGGVFSYVSFEIDSLSRAHQRALFKHFSSISIRPMDLNLPAEVRDAWWADAMVVVKAIR